MAKKLALVFGIVFLLVGILGLVGGVGIVGPDGIFMTDMVHDWVHLVSGILFVLVALAAAKTSAGLMKFFGVVYLLVGILGLFMNPVLGFLNVNAADNVLHLVLGVVILWAGIASGKKAMSMPTQQTM